MRIKLRNGSGWTGAHVLDGTTLSVGLTCLDSCARYLHADTRRVRVARRLDTRGRCTFVINLPSLASELGPPQPCRHRAL